MNQFKHQPTTVLIGIAIVTLVAIISQPPNLSMLSEQLAILVIYGVMTAFALNFRVALLNEGELSPAHAVGMVAFLSLPQALFPAALWAIFLGGLGGSSIQVVRGWLRQDPPSYKQQMPCQMICATARVTLSFYVAAQFYILSNQPLPLSTLKATDNPHVIGLFFYGLLYVGSYLGLFILELQLTGYAVQQILRENTGILGVILLLPLPFAMLGAPILVQNSQAPMIFIILLSGMMMIIIGLHALSYSHWRLKQQLTELQSLSVVTQVMRANLSLETLLRAIYMQLAKLLNVQNFYVAIYRNEQKLSYVFIVENGKQIDPNTREVDAITRHVAEQQTPLLLNDAAQETAQDMDISNLSPEAQSWLGVPLLTGEQRLGAMVIVSFHPLQHFGSEALRLLNIVAASASIAIENMRLYRQKSERADRLAILNKVAALLSGSLSPDAVLDAIVSSAAMVSDATAVGVYLFDEEKTSIQLVRSAGLSGHYADNPPPPISAEQKGELYAPLIIYDVHSDPRTEPLRPYLAAEGKAAIIETPLRVGNETLGIMALFFDEPLDHNEEAIELISTFATQAAQAINNARRFSSTGAALERRVEQLYALAALGRLMSATMERNRIFTLVLSYAIDATKAERGVIILRDERNGLLEAVMQQGFPEAAFNDRSMLEQGITGEVLRTGSIKRIEDVRKETNYLPIVPATRSQLTVPVLRGREILGVVTLESGKTAAFSEEDSHFLAQMTNQMVVTLENADMFHRIREGRDRLQVILDAIADGLIVIDHEGVISLANPRVDLLGLRPEQLLYRPIANILADEESDIPARLGFPAPRELTAFVERLKNGDWQDMEDTFYGVQSTKGMVYIERRVLPIHDDKSHLIGALLVFYDKTQEHELARAQEDLSRMVVHDMRSPLTAVTTSLRLLRELVPEDSELKPVVEKTTDASRRAIRKVLNRVDALLDIARMEGGEFDIDTEPAELYPIVDSVCTELEPLAQEMNVTLVNGVPRDLPLLDIDVDKVERTIMNLVDNALKYSPAHSAIRIAAQVMASDDEPPTLVRVSVADKGPGIPDDYKASLFDRYVQIEGRRRVRRGVGLGLTFCKMVAEAHGGRIWIEDNVGGGSVFVVSLPLLQMRRLPDDDF